jgi:hypothetical protein
MIHQQDVIGQSERALRKDYFGESAAGWYQNTAPFEIGGSV